MNPIYTIGYSCFSIEDFISVLLKYNINCIVDVRSRPYSKHYIEYDKKNIKKRLEQDRIIYRNYADEFGARQNNTNYYTDGYLDFNKFCFSSQFLNGLKKIEDGMKLNYRFAFMCAEKDPSTCHRNIMIARQFYKRGYPIYNILHDGSIETQEHIEERLIDKYFPNRSQLTLFGDELTRDEMIDECYSLRNSEIGYRPNKEKAEDEDYE